MIIGGVTLPEQYTPLDCTKPRAMRSTVVMGTYGGVAVFDWGSILAGKEIKMTWRVMTVALFEALDVLYLAGDAVVWDSGIGGKVYRAKITAFDGSLLFDRMGEYMLNVAMTLVILDEVVA